MIKVPYWNVQYGSDDAASIAASIEMRCISQGEKTLELEKLISKLLLRNDDIYVTMVTSGSMALVLSMLALGIGPGDEVIIPNYTWVATAHAPALLGAHPVFVDCCLDNPLIDASHIEKCITSKTKAIICTHLNGRACDMPTINKIAETYGLYVVEDATQAFFPPT